MVNNKFFNYDPKSFDAVLCLSKRSKLFNNPCSARWICPSLPFH